MKKAFHFFSTHLVSIIASVTVVFLFVAMIGSDTKEDERYYSLMMGVWLLIGAVDRVERLIEERLKKE